MKKIIAMLLALVMVLALAACGSSGANDSGTPDTEDNNSDAMTNIGATGMDEDAVRSDTYLRETVTIGSNSDGGSFNPYSRAGWGCSTGIFQPLANTDSNGVMRLCMIKSYEKVDDLTYNIELWDCIRDSAGNNITADDVLWSVTKYVDEGNAGGVNCLDHVEVTGTYTFTWYCSSPFSLGDMEKNWGNFNVISQKAWEDSGADEMTTKPVGTGPYMLKDYVAGSYVLLEANENFWMKDITDETWLAENDYVTNYQNVQYINLQIIQDAASLAVALEMGEVDAVNTLNAADVQNFINNPALGCKSFNMKVNPPIAWYYNVSDQSECSDINLRKAICYALNNEALSQGLSLPGYVVYGMQPNMYDAPADWMSGREYYDYDLDTARQLVDQSSYDGSTLVIMYSGGTAVFEDMAVMMQAALKEIGISVELLPVDNAVLNSYKADLTCWDLAFETLGGGNYCSATLKKWWTENNAKNMNGLNSIGIIDEKLDELYVTLKADPTEENIVAWDQYFTYDMCYGYAVCCYYNQSACRADVNPVMVGAQNTLVPGAFTFEG